MSEPTNVRIGLLGCGNVGSALVELVGQQAEVIAARTGLQLEVARVAVHSPAKSRSVSLPEGVLTHDADDVVADPSIDVVVEVMGGFEPARRHILAALEAKKPVVTANKELLANAGPELFGAAAASGVDLLYEAAVAGGIPIIRPLRESLAGDRIRRLTGIVNGTTNFVLTRMTEEGDDFQEALAEAQTLGYAERDPTADVEGLDAAAKAAILATIAFGVSVAAGDVYREGIAGITPGDIAMATRLGYVIKPVAVVESFGEGDGGQPGEVAVRVHPALVPTSHPLGAVRDSFNAVFIEADAVGELMFYGRGAGGRPTASAILGDLIDAVTNLRRGRHPSAVTLEPAHLRPIDDLCSQYYVAMDVVDRHGVLHQISGVTAEHGVSIEKVEQVGLGDDARLVFVTHTAPERAIQSTLNDLGELEVVRRIGTLLRVIGAE